MQPFIRVIHSRPGKALWPAVCASLVLLTSSHALAKPGRHAPLMDGARAKYGEPGVRALDAWQHLLDSARDLPEDAKLRRVNDFFNQRVAFQSDQEIWGTRDYWATPLETLVGRRGDCEDYSVAKYATLRLLGIPEHRLRLAYVVSTPGGPHGRIREAHLVLDYLPAPEAEPLVLDNLTSEIRPASRRPDLRPVFSFNREGLWFAGNDQVAGPAQEHLALWRQLLARMTAEGFE